MHTSFIIIEKEDRMHTPVPSSVALCEREVRKPASSPRNVAVDKLKMVVEEGPLDLNIETEYTTSVAQASNAQA